MDEKKNWYALKVFSNKVLAFKELVEKDSVETYIAMQQGKPLISSLMFIKSTEDYLKSLREQHLSEISYYKRACYRGKQVVYVPAVIPDDQIEVFRRATAEGYEFRFLGDLKNLNLNPGDRVRVVEGPFKGQEGYLKRIKKDRKFVITIGNIAAFTIEGVTHRIVEKM